MKIISFLGVLFFSRSLFEKKSKRALLVIVNGMLYHGVRNDTNNNDSCSSGTCLRNTIGGTDGEITAKISNIRANNLDSHNDTLIESNSNSFSNGDADITGIQTENNILIDGDTTRLQSKTATIHSGSAKDFSEINTANVISEESQTASSNSSAFTNSNTTVDISVSEFTNSFQQAF